MSHSSITTSQTSQTSHSEWRPKAVVFDLLTALLDSWSVWDASTPQKTPDEGRRWRSRYLELTYASTHYVPYEDLVRQAAYEVGLPASAPEVLVRNWKRISPWPDVKKVLTKLKSNGYKLGIVTNCSIDLGQQAVLNASVVQNEKTFDAVVTAEEVGFYKPSPAAYRAILKLLNVAPHDTLFVAGSAGDVQGASSVGMKVVWHNHVGLAPKGEAMPLKEASTLEGALEDFL